MPRGRKEGNINRKPGIFGQSIEKVYTAKVDKDGNPLLDANGNEVKVIDRTKVNIKIDFNDKAGNRFTRVFEARMNKEGTGVHIPINGAETSLVSEYKESEAAPAEPTPLALWHEAEREAIRKIREEMQLGVRGRIPTDKRKDYDHAVALWYNDNPRPANS
jgi:hypothetical protein